MAASSALASTQAQRKNRHLGITAGGLLLFATLYLLAQYAIAIGLTTRNFVHTLIWAIPPYLIAAQLIYQSLNLPKRSRAALLFINSLSPFLGMVLALALMQLPYSRSAMLLTSMLTLSWFRLSNHWWQNQDAMRLLIIDHNAQNELESQLDKTATRWLSEEIEYVHWLNPYDEIPSADGALVTDSHSLAPDELEQLNIIKRKHIRLYSTPAIIEMLTGRKSYQELLNPLWQPDGNPAYDIVKRIADIAITLACLPIWFPLALLVAVAVKLDSRGPALYNQTRTGLHGRPFRIWKFRTMITQQDTTARFAQANDKRITRLGQILRKSRLDEIPQFINVLLGHMSLIGPRPEQHSFVNDFATSIPSYPYRHLVRPGLTGWAQVMQGYAASEEETAIKLSYDLYYVSHYSITLDLLIATKTIKTLLTGQGAR